MAIGITGANNGYSRTAADNRFLGRDGGTINGNLTVTGTLSTTLLEAISANITILDIRQYELSGFNVSGNATVQGTISASGNLLTASGVTAGGTGTFSQGVNVNPGNGYGFKIGSTGIGSGYGWTGVVPDTIGLYVGYGFNINATPLLSRYAVSFLNTGTQSKLAIGLDNSFNSAVASLSTLTFYVGSSATMSLTDNGRVGIGTSTPASVLDIPGSGDTSLGHIILGKVNHGGKIRFRRGSDGAAAATLGYDATDGGPGFQLNSGGGSGTITLLAAGGPVNVYSANVNPFSFAANGNFGVGTIYPNAKVDVLDTTLAGSTGLSGSILNLTQTWATSGAPTSIKLDVTDTSSSASSLLMDLRIGSRSSYSFGKTTLTLPPSANSGIVWPGISLQNAPCSITRAADDTLSITAQLGSGKTITIGGNGYGVNILNWAFTINTGLGAAYLAADGTDILALRRNTGTQTFRIYNTYTSLTNFERLNLRWDTNVIKIGTEKGAAGGVARDLAFETDATTRMHITSAGNIGIATTAPGNILHLDCTLNRGILLTNSTQAPNRANYFINAGNGGAYNCLNISESYDNILYGHIQAYARSLYLGGFANATSVASVTVLNDQNKLDLLQLRQGLIGSSTVFKVASSGDTTIYGSVSAVRYLGLQDSLSGNPVLIGGNSTGSNLLIGTNDNFNLNLETAGTTKMTITSGGNVGIGTTAFTGKLEIMRGSSDNGVILRLGDLGSATGNFDFTRNASNGALQIQGNQTGFSNIVLAATSGNVGIGTTVPRYKFSNTNIVLSDWAGVEPSITSGFGWMASEANKYASNFANNTSGGYGMSIYANSNGTQKLLTLSNNSADVVNFLANGNVGIGTTTPDSRLHINAPIGSKGQLQIQDTSAAGLASSHLLSFYDNAGARQAYIYKEGTSGKFGIFNDQSGSSVVTTLNNVLNVTGAGNVGIGTATPDGKLDVILSTINTYTSERIKFGPSMTLAHYGSGYSGLWLGGTVSLNVPNANNYTLISDGTGTIVNSPSGDVYVSITNSPKLVVRGSGNVGIGTTLPTEKLTVVGSISSNSTVYGNVFTVPANGIINSNTANGGYIQFVSNLVTTFHNGTVGVSRDDGYVCSDSRGYSWGSTLTTGEISLRRLNTNTLVIGNRFATETRSLAISSLSATGNITVAGNGLFGQNTPVSTATPINVSFGGTYGSSTPGSKANLKWDMYNSGSGDRYGIGMSAGLMEFQAGNSGGFGFYPNASTTAALFIASDGRTGIGVTAPRARIHVNGGDDNSVFSNATIALGYSSTGDYPHFIHTRHNNGTAAVNAIDFYTSNGTAAGVFPTHAVHGLTINGGSVGVGTTSPNEKLSVSGNISSSRVIYASGGNSDLWNSSYSTVNAISANGATTYTTVNANSANWSNAYTITNANSANWSSVYTTYNAVSADILRGTISSSGQGNITIPRLNGANESITIGELGTGGNPTFANLTVSGNLSVIGDFTYLNTAVSVTSALSVVNTGTGPALYVKQSGTTPIAHFIDADGTGDIIFENNGFVGLGTGSPNQRLSVVGNISSTGVIYASGGNSDLWNSAYTTTNANSANYILAGGNSKGANLLIGTNDNYALNLETAGTTKMTVTSAGFVGIGIADPSSILDISDGTGSQKNVTLSLRNGNFGWWTITSSNSNTSGFLRFASNNSGQTPLTLDGATGNVGISNNAPAARLDIADTALAGSGGLQGSALNITQTWATSGAPTSIKLNVTNNSSGAASNLLDLQVGTVSEFRVSKGGSIFSRAAIGTNAGNPGVDGLSLEMFFAGYGIGTNSNGDAVFYQNNVARTRVGFGVAIANDWSLAFTNTTHVGGDAAVDLYLNRRGPANLRLGNLDAAAPVAQTLSVQSVVAGTTNLSGTNFTIAGSQGTGTGAGGSIVFQTAPAGSSGTAVNPLSTVLTINSTGKVGIGVTNPAYNLTIQTADTSAYSYSSIGILKHSNSAADGRSALTFAGDFGNSFRISQNGYTTTGTNTPNHAAFLEIFNQNGLFIGTGQVQDLYAQFSTAIEKRFSIYSTLNASLTNYERLSFKPQSGGAFLIMSEAAGTGSYRDIEIQNGGSTRIDITSGGNIGIGNTTPNEKLTVSGNISSTNVVYALGGNSDLWNNTFTTVNASSANYILDGGNTKGANLLVGTNDSYALNLETAGTTRMTVTSAGNVGIGTTPGSNGILHILNGTTSNIYLASNTSNDGTHEIRFGFHTLQSYAASIVGIRTGGGGRGNLEFRVAGGGDSTNAVQSDTALRITSTSVDIIKPIAYAQDIFAMGDNLNGGVKAFKFTRSENKAAIWSVPGGSQGRGDIRFTTGDEFVGTAKTESDATVIIARKGGLILGNSYISSQPTGGTLLVSDMVGIGTTTPLAKLDISETWNSNISVTGASGTGSVATITFDTQAAVIPVGATVVVSSVNPSGYNGTFVVTASTVTSISYTNSTTATYVSGGLVKQQYDAIRALITDTNSATTSNLLSLDLSTENALGAGNKWRFKVDKSGVLYTTGDIQLGIGLGISARLYMGNGPYSFGGNNGIFLGNGVTGYIFAHGSTQLWRGSADHIIEQRNGVNPQAFRLYNTYTDATTFERLNIKWDTNVLKIGTEKGSAGGGARAMEFQTDNTTRMTVTSAGNVGIGITEPANKLHVQGTAYGEGLRVTHSAGAGTRLDIIAGDGSQVAPSQVGFLVNGASKLILNSAGLILPAPFIRVGADAQTFYIHGGYSAATLGNSLILGSNTINGGPFTATSGTQNTVSIGVAGNESWNPASGNAAYNLLRIAPTVNTSGTYAGIVRGLYINPTLTSVIGTDFRALDLSNTSGFGVYQSGASANNYFAGNIGIGTTSPNERLTVVGTVSAAGDFAVATSLQGVILVSPNSTRWRITVNDNGSLQTTAL